MPSSPLATPTDGLNTPLYLKIIAALLGAMLLVTTARLAGYPLTAAKKNGLVDFHSFYIVSQLFWKGSINQAYYVLDMLHFQHELAGGQSFMPWSYPPQYNLIVAPLSILPLGAAYFLFTAATLAAYLATLRRLAGPHLTIVLLTILPALIVLIACGQNGFLTGTGIGLVCLGLLHDRAMAGLPLGLMVIKPHLAVGLAFYALLTSRWRMILMAALVVGATSMIATIFSGPTIWASFLHGLQETRIFLEEGIYPLHRMISPYAAIRSLGAPAGVALAVQAVVAALSLAAIGAAVRCRLPRARQLGIATLGTLLVSPYAYDYDMPIYGIGLALLMPDLLRLGTRGEQIAMFGLSFFTCSWGLAKTTVLELQFGTEGGPTDFIPGSLAGITLLCLYILIWRVLRRDRRSRFVGTTSAIAETERLAPPPGGLTPPAPAQA